MNGTLAHGIIRKRSAGRTQIIIQVGAVALIMVMIVACTPGKPSPMGNTIDPEPKATATASVPEHRMGPSPSSNRRRQLWGYVPNFDRPSAWSTAKAHRHLLTGISLFQYRLDGHGDLLAYPNQGHVPDWLVAEKLPVIPVITNLVDNDWNRDVVAAVLGDPARRRHHIEQIVALAVAGSYPGVELDYESLTAAEREPFSVFIEELAAALHARGKHLAVAVHAKVAEPGEWGGPQAQDWSRIGAAADRVIVLAYDYNTAQPNPIAPLTWTRDVLRFAVSRIPAAKVVQGVPLYGYVWSGDAPGVGHTYQEVLKLAREHGVQPRRDAQDRHLVFDYSANGVRHQVWFTDADTVAALVAVGQDLGLAGYALWRLGGEDSSGWSVLERASSRGR